MCTERRVTAVAGERLRFRVVRLHYSLVLERHGDRSFEDVLHEGLRGSKWGHGVDLETSTERKGVTVQRLKARPEPKAVGGNKSRPDPSLLT